VRSDRSLRAALYVGGLLGPFGGGLVNAMLPELRDTFAASSSQVGASLTVYFVPFALALLVSGTLGERWGRRRTVQAAYLAYAAASLACALAPSLGLFLAGRALQGAANAFTTPLLLAGLVELAEPARTGRAVGIYASFQAAGQSLSPVVGGTAAELDWRLAFVGIALVAFSLSRLPPPGEARPAAEAPPWRTLLLARVGVLGLAASAAAVGAMGIAFLVALQCRDGFGLGPSAGGFVLVASGLAGLVLGPSWGRVTDLVGSRRAGMVAAVAAGCLVVVLGRVDHLGVFVGLWVATGAVSALLSVSVQGLATGLVPANRGGGVSTTLAFRFAGHAVAPLAWLPLADTSGLAAAFAGAGVVTFAVALLLWPLGRAVPGPSPGWGGPARA
jgi:MFS family permease